MNTGVESQTTEWHLMEEVREPLRSLQKKKEGRRGGRREEWEARKVEVETSAGNKIYLEASISSFRLRVGETSRGIRKTKRNIDRRVEEPSSSKDVSISIYHLKSLPSVRTFTHTRARIRTHIHRPGFIKVSPPVQVAKYFGFDAL